MVTKDEGSRARELVSQLKKQRREFSHAVSRSPSETDKDYTDKVGLNIMTTRMHGSQISALEEDSYLHDGDDEADLNDSYFLPRHTRDSFGIGLMEDDKENKENAPPRDYDDGVAEAVPHSASFECVLNASDGFDDEDDDSMPPPPPPPLPPRWKKASAHTIPKPWTKTTLGKKNKDSRSVEGHNGAMLLETFDKIEATDERVTTATTTLLSGEQARVTLIPNSVNAGPYAGFHNDRLLYHWGDSGNSGNAFRKQQHSGRLKRVLTVMACLILCLAAFVLLLGIQRMQQDDSVDFKPTTSAAVAYADDESDDELDDEQSPPTQSPTPAPTECIDSLFLEWQCYAPGEPITVFFRNCDPEEFDWVGLYEVANNNLNPNQMPEPIDFLVTNPTVTGELYFYLGISEVGVYKAFMFRDTAGPTYPSFASSEQEILVSAMCA